MSSDTLPKPASFSASLLVRFILICLAFACVPGSAAAPSISASVAPNPVGVGDSARLTLTLSAHPSEPLQLSLPGSIQRGQQGQSISQSLINGQLSSSIVYTIELLPTQEGEFTIPKIQTVIDGVRVSTEPLILRVTKESAAARDKSAFLKLVPSKREVFVGELFPINLQVFFLSGNITQFPQLKSDGFIIGKQPQPTQTRVQMDNRVYTLFDFRMSIAAAKTGLLQLGPAEEPMVLILPSRDPFGGLFGGGQQRPVTLQSDSHQINVLPLPTQGMPASFNGAMGRFNLDVSAGPTSLSVGDPITVRMVIHGRGNFDALTAPSVDWAGFRAYPPSSTSTNTDVLGMEGTKIFEQVVIPESHDVKVIPAMQFSFFDPDQKRYETISRSPIGLEIKALVVAQAQPTVLAETNDAPLAVARDLVHIKPQLEGAITVNSPLAARPWFVAVQAIPLAAFLIATGWRKRKDRFERDPRLGREKQVNAMEGAALKQIRAYAAANQADAFYAAVFRLLQERIGERLDVPASGITEAVIDERLARGISPSMRQTLHELFQLCNAARYAAEGANENLTAHLSKVEMALKELRQVKL